MRFVAEQIKRPTRLTFRLGAMAALLLLVGLGISYWRSGGEDPVIAEATLLVAEGVEAHRRGDSRLAKLKLNGAVGLIVSFGLVDDVPPSQVREAALRLLERNTPDSLDLPEFYLSVIEGARARPQVAANGLVRRGPCRLDRVSADDLALCIRERAEQVLVELWEDPREIPELFYQAVDEQLRFLSLKRRDWVEASFERGRAYRYLMETELEAAKMPKILHYLSMVESGYQLEVSSSAGARGLWQFMPRTARAYGLEVSSTVDERTDPKKATKAAASYLRDLAFEFGGNALLLAIASYNKGENSIRYALKQLDDPRTQRNYWALVERDLIPRETRDYVPRLVAVATMGEAGVPSAEALRGR